MQEEVKSGNLAINGMGRIGRTLVRLLAQNKELGPLIAVNDIMPKENLVYLLKYDSIRGPLTVDITTTANGFSIGGHEIHYYQQSDIRNIPWHKHAIETVVEATGLFTQSTDASLHLANGPGRVLLSTYSKDIPSTIRGVNHQSIQPDTKIISPGDCTTNCVAPIIHLLLQQFGIRSLHINVIQGYTTRQELLDGPYKGLRRGRAAAHSIIPFEVNITPVLETIFPPIKGKTESMSTRVPVACGALADISVVLEKESDAASINAIFEKASSGSLKNITDITFDPIVSADIINNPHSGVIDGSLTKVINRQHLKLMVWFDNEWGFVNRLREFLR